MQTKNCNLFKLGLCKSPINPQPLENFFESIGVKDGRGSRCKICIKVIAHERRLAKGGGSLRVPKRSKSVPVLQKNCSKFKKGQCAAEMNPQPIINFRLQQGRINGKSICLSCEKKYSEDHKEKILTRVKAWQQDPKNKENRRHKNRMKLYSLSPEQYNAMFVSQNGRCATCGISNDQSSLCVDHCHKSGKVRALLCSCCNRGLGYFKDNATLIRKMADYVERYEDVH